MEFKGIISKVKDTFQKKKEQFKELKKEKKIAIVVGVVAVILALAFGVKYINDSKYQLLFSGLTSEDAISITKELENQGVEMKVEGDSIYVPKEQVDKLRLELSGGISNGSKGFELMDETSSFGLTDEEFSIKKQRMVQGEIEKTIKTFQQVEDARVNITQGQESVFSDEGTPGSAAVAITLKAGQSLEPSQIKSIMSLVSASSTNIPKQNVEVVDQNMNLLSDGLFDDKGNASNSNGIDVALKAEKELSRNLEKSIVSLLEPIFGAGKVKATVNADLNFDNREITETSISPKTVVMKESRSENKTTEQGNTGGSVDNNMNNVSGANDGTTSSKDESIEYDTGKKETKTTKAQGELNKITASVAIDGILTDAQITNVNDMVANTIGMDEKRGDDVKVVAMDFGANADEASKESGISDNMKLLGFVLLAVALAGVVAFIVINRAKKKKEEEYENYDDVDEIELINRKIEEMEGSSKSESEDDEEESITLEEEVRKYASENPDRVTDLINSWLNV